LKSDCHTKNGKTFKKKIDILKAVQSSEFKVEITTRNMKLETAQDKAGAWKK